MDELEDVTSPTTRRRFPKKKNADYSKEIVIGSVVAVAGIALLIVYIAVASQDTAKHGYDAIGNTAGKPPESPRAKIAEEHKQKAKEIAKEKSKETTTEKRPGTNRASASGGDVSPLRPFVADARPSQRSHGRMTIQRMFL